MSLAQRGLAYCLVMERHAARALERGAGRGACSGSCEDAACTCGGCSSSHGIFPLTAHELHSAVAQGDAALVAAAMARRAWA